MKPYSREMRKWIGRVNRFCFRCEVKMKEGQVTCKYKGVKQRVRISVCPSCGLKAEMGESYLKKPFPK